jgi:hypothetical protein
MCFMITGAFWSSDAVLALEGLDKIAPAREPMPGFVHDGSPLSGLAIAYPSGLSGPSGYSGDRSHETSFRSAVDVPGPTSSNSSPPRAECLWEVKRSG